MIVGSAALQVVVSLDLELIWSVKVWLMLFFDMRKWIWPHVREVLNKVIVNTRYFYTCMWNREKLAIITGCFCFLFCFVFVGFLLIWIGWLCGRPMVIFVTVSNENTCYTVWN